MELQTKICNKCKKELSIDLFFKDKTKKDGLTTICKKCKIAYNKVYSKKNKEKIKTYHKDYQERNKEKLKAQKKAYHEKNKKEISAHRKIYWKKNKEKLKAQRKIYRERNKEEINNKAKIYYKEKALYNIYKKHESLILVEKIRCDPNNNELIQVKCTYCGRWINPTNMQVRVRIQAINGTITGEGRFYCNDNNDACCNACPIYRKAKYPKGFKKATSREVQPELRQMVLARDNYTCQKCSLTIDQAELHCHHITGVVQNPLESADVDNCVTLCKACHKQVHKLPGCGYNELKCN